MTGTEGTGVAKATAARRFRLGFYLLFAAGVVAYIYSRVAGAESTFDWVRFAKSVEQLDWAWLVASVLLSLGCYYVRAVRWVALMNAAVAKPSIGAVFSATAVGFSALILLGRPGEFVRPYLIAKKTPASFTSQLGVWVLERIFDFLAVLMLFGVGLVRVENSGAQVGEKMRWVMQTGGQVVALGSVFFLLLIVALRAFSGHPRENLEKWAGYLPARLQRGTHLLLVEFAEGVESVRDLRTLLVVLGYTLLEWGLIVAGYFALLRALLALPPFTLTDVLILLGFSALGSLIQIPGVGGGMQVVTVMVLTDLFKIPFETASGVALVIWAVTFLVILPVGMAFAVREGITWKKLKTMGKLQEIDAPL